MTTKRLPEQARRPDFDVDPLRDVDAALSGLEWVTATHPIPPDEDRIMGLMVALGRFLIIAISFVLVTAILAVG